MDSVRSTAVMLADILCLSRKLSNFSLHKQLLIFPFARLIFRLALHSIRSLHTLRSLRLHLCFSVWVNDVETTDCRLLTLST